MVLAASFTSTQEIMALAGLQHMTIAAPLLEELSSTPYDSTNKPIPTLFDDPDIVNKAPRARLRLADDEPAFRLAFSQSNNGHAQAKLTQVRSLQGYFFFAKEKSNEQYYEMNKGLANQRRNASRRWIFSAKCRPNSRK